MQIMIKKADDLSELQSIARLADEIWHECFVGIITVEQIDYMVDKFQSYEAILNQVETMDYSYFSVYDDGILCGYFGVKPESDSRFFLSKLYLHQSKRGNGIASSMLSKVFEEARKCSKKSVYLTVNKHNYHAFDVYMNVGFQVIDETVTDIGNGFVMDDFVMEYKL